MAGHKATLDLLKKYDLKPSRLLGQNFLVDDNINRFIVKRLELAKTDLVLEIGAGLGELISLIKDEAGLVLALEIDRGLSRLLRERFQAEKSVKVIEADILKCDLAKLAAEYDFERINIVGNLPYCISSPIIFHLIKYRQLIKKTIIMLQKEVACRLTAPAGSRDYGILSCLLDYYGEKKIIKQVSRSCFWPRPKVDSAIIELVFYKRPPVRAKNEVFLKQVIKAAFSQRRKTIVNTLVSLKTQAADKHQLIRALESIKIDPARRAEQFSAADFARIADCLCP